VRLSTQRSRYSAWIAVAGGNSGVTALLSFLWKRPQPVARVNVSTSAAGAKYFMMSVCRLVVEDPSSDRERIFLVSLRQFLLRMLRMSTSLRPARAAFEAEASSGQIS